LPRHEQLAPKAADLLAPDLMPEVNLRADAARDLYHSATRKQAFDLAYAAFHGDVMKAATDGRNPARETDVLIAATRVAIETNSTSQELKSPKNGSRPRIFVPSRLLSLDKSSIPIGCATS